MERVRGVEPLSSVWKTDIITAIRYPLVGILLQFTFTHQIRKLQLSQMPPLGAPIF